MAHDQFSGKKKVEKGILKATIHYNKLYLFFYTYLKVGTLSLGKNTTLYIKFKFFHQFTLKFRENKHKKVGMH